MNNKYNYFENNKFKHRQAKKDMPPRRTSVRLFTRFLLFVLDNVVADNRAIYTRKNKTRLK